MSPGKPFLSLVELPRDPKEEMLFGVTLNLIFQGQLPTFRPENIIFVITNY